MFFMAGPERRSASLTGSPPASRLNSAHLATTLSKPSTVISASQALLARKRAVMLSRDRVSVTGEATSSTYVAGGAEIERRRLTSSLRGDLEREIGAKASAQSCCRFAGDLGPGKDGLEVEIKFKTSYIPGEGL